MKVLFLTNLLPYPLDSGGNIKTYATLTALKRGNYDVDVVCFTEDKEKDEKNKQKLLDICHSIELIEGKLVTRENIFYMLRKAFFSLFSKYPFVVYKYKNNRMLSLIEKKLSENKYDFIYFEHLQMFLYYDLLKEKIQKNRVILDQQNCESLILRRMWETAQNKLKKLFFQLEYVKLKKVEKEALQKADKVYVLSEQDFQYMKSLAGDIKNYSIIPISITDKGVLSKAGIKTGVIKLLFLGTLTWEPNNQGIVWFVKKVVPLLEKADIKFELYIVGKNPSRELQDMVQDKENIIVTGYVESVEEYYEKTDVMVVPLFIGGGQRVKIIEAFSKGIPVISTSVGAEGLGYTDGKNILIADDEKGYVKAIEKIFDVDLYKKLTINERTLYEEKYSLDSYCNEFIKTLSGIDKD